MLFHLAVSPTVKKCTPTIQCTGILSSRARVRSFLTSASYLVKLSPRHGRSRCFIAAGALGL